MATNSKNELCKFKKRPTKSLIEDKKKFLNHRKKGKRAKNNIDKDFEL